MLTDKEKLSKTEAEQINPVVLAFLGDAVYSLYVRERLVCSGEGKASQFQVAAGKIVSAQGQSVFLDKLLPLFNEEEAAVFRRAKNAKKTTKSKSASNLEYSRSTGFEAVLGYLYLTGNEERIKELLRYSDESLFHTVEQIKAFKPSR